VHIGKCVSLPDISDAIIDNKQFKYYTTNTVDISANLDRVKETVQCGYNFTYTPKLLLNKMNNVKELVSFDDGKQHENAPELIYDS
jgi:hypothetical protein